MYNYDKYTLRKPMISQTLGQMLQTAAQTVISTIVLCLIPKPNNMDQRSSNSAVTSLFTSLSDERATNGDKGGLCENMNNMEIWKYRKQESLVKNNY